MTGEVVTGTGDAMTKEERIWKGSLMHKMGWEEKRSLQARTEPGEKQHALKESEWGI